jgi:hypothetical protein
MTVICLTKTIKNTITDETYKQDYVLNTEFSVIREGFHLSFNLAKREN